MTTPAEVVSASGHCCGVNSSATISGAETPKVELPGGRVESFPFFLIEHAQPEGDVVVNAQNPSYPTVNPNL